MATTTKSTPKHSTRKAQGSKAKPKAKASTKKATPRPQYSDEVRAIAAKARAMACPKTLQGPVPRQVQDVQRVIKEGPCEALASVGLTAAKVKAYAKGNNDKDTRAKLRPLGQRVVKAGGAKQWCTGRPLAATLTAWLEQK